MLRAWCLCAAWCRLCDDYGAVFAAATAEAGVPGAWIDIEDDEELLGDVDVEDFPTLLVADANLLLFYGTVTPQQGVLTRLLRSAAAGELAPGDGAAAAAAGAMLGRLRAAGR